MSTLTIELPDIVARQIEQQGLSQQELETMVISIIQLYLAAPAKNAEKRSFSAKTLQDLRGSIPVVQPQDFTAIRQHVITTQIRQRQAYGE